GTRSGIIHDDRYAALLAALQPLENHINGLIKEQQRAEEEKASQQLLKAIQRAFHEALLALPPEEYDWFDVQTRARQEGTAARPTGNGSSAAMEFNGTTLGVKESANSDSARRQFFYFAGPLFGVIVSPGASTIPLNERRKFRALPR